MKGMPSAFSLFYFKKYAEPGVLYWARVADAALALRFDPRSDICKIEKSSLISCRKKMNRIRRKRSNQENLTGIKV